MALNRCNTADDARAVGVFASLGCRTTGLGSSRLFERSLPWSRQRGESWIRENPGAAATISSVSISSVWKRHYRNTVPARVGAWWVNDVSLVVTPG